ncbi:hypothetical protein ABZW49_10175 [Nonomuraea wenchangensis]
MLLDRLAACRATAALHQSHPDLTFSLLPWTLDRLGGDAWDVFHAGFSVMAARYESLGLHRLLPLDRVWVGVRSSRAAAFGGFHHPDQGYRHLQMGAVVTRYGPLDRPAGSPALVALDLLRAYAHDCLHYGSCREYQMHDGRLVRTQYGFNRRDLNGRSYSAPDTPDATTTRNLGVIMEGATDREASSIARQAAHRVGIAEPDGVDRFAFRDVVGRLTADDLTRLPAEQDDDAQRLTVNGFLAAMGSYARGVNRRYGAFLVEIGGAESETLHDLLLTAMISGAVAPLSAWLGARHPGGFTNLFRAASYAGPEPA